MAVSIIKNSDAPDASSPMAGHVVRAEDEIILVEATLARTGRWSRARREKGTL